jgi:hypothetical protein
MRNSQAAIPKPKNKKNWMFDEPEEEVYMEW